MGRYGYVVSTWTENKAGLASPRAQIPAQDYGTFLLLTDYSGYELADHYFSHRDKPCYSLLFIIHPADNNNNTISSSGNPTQSDINTNNNISLTMSQSVVVKTRKFMKNPLLSRRQVSSSSAGVGSWCRCYSIFIALISRRTLFTVYIAFIIYYPIEYNSQLLLTLQIIPHRPNNRWL